MSIHETTTFEVSTQGDIDPAAIDRARERIGRIASHCREPITHVELRVTDDPHHRSQPHARAEATLVVKHGPVRAHARAGTVHEAIDFMLDRLRRRVDRHESKLHRIGVKRRDGVASDGNWRHGDVDSAPRRPRPLANDDAAVVRRKTFATAPMSVEEAIFDLDILDHDFYLFEESTTGQTCVVSYGESGYRLGCDDADIIDLPAEYAIEQTGPPPVLDKPSVQRTLVETEEPFVFHRVGSEHGPQVMYRRYDGDFGIVELGDTSSPKRAAPAL